MKQEQWDFKYFKAREFDSPDEQGSGYNMDKKFIEKLELLRERTGLPIIIVSGFRTEKWNKSCGGKINSEHLRGKSADIKYHNSYECFIIMQEAFKLKFLRIGINKTTIHLGIDTTLPQMTLWNYYK